MGGTAMNDSFPFQIPSFKSYFRPGGFGHLPSLSPDEAGGKWL
jgi:hypothetical protein